MAAASAPRPPTHLLVAHWPSTSCIAAGSSWWQSGSCSSLGATAANSCAASGVSLRCWHTAAASLHCAGPGGVGAGGVTGAPALHGACASGRHRPAAPTPLDALHALHALPHHPPTLMASGTPHRLSTHSMYSTSRPRHTSNSGATLPRPLPPWATPSPPLGSHSMSSARGCGPCNGWAVSWAGSARQRGAGRRGAAPLAGWRLQQRPAGPCLASATAAAATGAAGPGGAAAAAAHPAPPAAPRAAACPRARRRRASAR